MHDRIGKFHGHELDRILWIAKRIAGCRRLRADDSADVAGPQLFQVGPVVRVHLEQTAESLAVKGNRSSFRCFLAALGFAMSGWLSGCSDGATSDGLALAERTNVLLVVIDSIRADHLSCYGHEHDTTPELDALAAASVRYRNAFSQAPWTTPSIGSLLSSQYPTVLGIHHTESALSEELILLPEVLQASGIATGAVVSHSFTSAKWGFGQGFDFFDESNIKDYEAVTSPGVSASAIQFLDRHRDRPFFLFLHYFDPHFAYVDHDRFSFGAGAAGYQGLVKSGQEFLPLAKQRDRLDGEDLEELHRLYDSELALTDHYIGKVLDHLRTLDLFDDALIIVTGDHGEEFMDHGMLGHAKTLYNELVSVPSHCCEAETAIVRWPFR